MRHIDTSRTTLTVEIGDGSNEAVARLKAKDGAFTKTVSVAALLTELSRDMETTTGILPAGTKFYAGTRVSYRVGIQVPAKVRAADFTLHDVGTRRMTVPFPEVLLVFGVRNKRIVESSLYACIPPVGRTYDRLYRFPFGNVYENGGVCWGNVEHPEVGEPIVLDSVVSRFFTSVFSGHIVHGTNMFHAPEGVVNLRTLLEHLSGQEHFPDRILKPSDITLGAAMALRVR
jgi:hypothetical protein